MSETEHNSESVSREEIAAALVAYVRENPGVCANVSIRAGQHPYIRYYEDEFQMVESVGYGEIEVQTIDEDSLTHLFANNPVELRPLDEATVGLSDDSDTYWERIETGEKVNVIA